MSKKTLLISLLVSILYTISSIAQEYDKKIQLRITIEDQASDIFSDEITQLHKLSFINNDFVYDIDDQVGFEISVNNQSTSGKTFNYRLLYAPYNYNSSENELTRGGLKPVTIPPIEDCEDDDDEDCEDELSSTEQNFPYTPINENIDLDSSQSGSDTVFLYLILNNELVSQISHPFTVTSKPSRISTKDIVLYPNPIGTYLNIQLEKDNTVTNGVASQNKATTPALIEVYNIHGTLIKRSSLIPSKDDLTLNYQFINPSLKRGTYIYKITINGKLYTKVLQKR